MELSFIPSYIGTYFAIHAWYMHCLNNHSVPKLNLVQKFCFARKLHLFVHCDNETKPKEKTNFHLNVYLYCKNVN